MSGRYGKISYVVFVWLLFLIRPVNADFIYTYDEELIGAFGSDSSCVPMTGMLRTGATVTDHQVTVYPNEIPVTVRTRTARIFGGKEYETMISQVERQNGVSRWMKVKSYLAGCSWGVVIGEASKRYLRLIFPEGRREEVESSKFGGIQAELLDYHWVGVRKGTTLFSSSDESSKKTPIGYDAMHLVFEVSIKNLTSEKYQWDTDVDRLMLVDSEGDFVPLKVFTYVLAPLKIDVYSHNGQVIKYQTNLENYDEVKRMQPAYLTHPGRGWKWKVPLPAEDKIEWSNQ
jgi:hypothetical protein